MKATILIMLLITFNLSAWAQPTPVTLASGLSISSRIVMDATTLYWAEEDNTVPYYTNATNGLIRSVSKNGGEVVTLVSGLNHPDGVAVYGAYVFFVERGSYPNVNGSIKKILKTGGEVVTVAAGLDYPHGGMFISNDTLFFVDPCSVKKVSIGGGPVVTIATDVCWGPGSIIADGLGSVFYSECSALTTDWGIRRVGTGGGTVSTLTPILTGGNDVILSAADVFWSEQGNVNGNATNGTGRVGKVAKGGGDATILASGLNTPFSLYLDASAEQIYWLETGTYASNVYNANTGVLKRMSTGGGAPTTILSGLNAPGILLMDETTAYWDECPGSGQCSIRKMSLISTVLSVDSVRAICADTVSIPVRLRLSEGTSYSSAEVSFSGFGGGMQFVGIDTVGTLTGNLGWSWEVNTSDTLVRCAFAGATAVDNSGIFFALKFFVTGPSCTFVPVVIASAIMNTGTDTVATWNGGVRITARPVYGDVDENGQVQAYDASLILRHVVDAGLITDCQQSANADVTGDGTISALDATGILKYVVGLIETLPYLPEGPVNAIAGLQGTCEGGFVDVPLTISQAANVFAFEATVAFDSSDLSLADTIWPTDILRDLHVSGGSIHVAGARTAASGGDGQLVLLRFTPKRSFARTTVSLKKLRLNEAPPQTNVSQVVVAVTGVEEATGSLPTDFALEQNHPNPFNPSTLIRYALPVRAHVRMTVYNTLGQLVAELVNAEKQAGTYEVSFDASGLASGAYLYRIQAGSYTETKRMVVVK